MTESAIDPKLQSYLDELPESANVRALFIRYGKPYAWMAMITVMIAMLSTMLMTTIVNIALPAIMGSFGIDQDRAQWLSTANLAAATVGMLVTFGVVRFWGMRKMLVGTMSIFLVSCVVGGLSPNFELMIATRVIQGLATGMMTPLTMSVVFLLFPAKNQGLAMGMSSIGIILAPALGPSVGGLLIDYFNWRYVFFIGIPLSVICLPMGLILLPDRDGPEPEQKFDWLGMVSLSMAITWMLVAFSNGERDGWTSNTILLYASISLVSWVVFIVRQMRIENPLLNMKILFHPRFFVYAITAFTFGAGLYASSYVIPLFLQIVQGMTPTDAGLAMMPAGLLMGVFSPLGGRMVGIISPRLAVSTGSVLFFLSFYLMVDSDTNTGFWTFVWWMCIGRFGISVAFPSMSIGAIRSLPEEYASQASGVLNFVRQLGGAYGVNLLSVVLYRRTEFHLDSLKNSQRADNSTTSELLALVQERLVETGISHYEQWLMSMQYLVKTIYAQASVLAFKDSFLVSAVVFLVTLIPAMLLKKPD